jgi:tetratricopeptide (TPR) repeat protein
MPIEGSLRDFGLHDIFQLLHLSRKTGVLGVTKEPSGVRGEVVFDGGAVVHAGVDEPTPRLGYMLLNAGKITEADLHRADQLHSQDSSRSWSEIFASLEVVEPEVLEEHVKFQVQEFVYEIVDWQDGYFLFSERPLAESECVTWIPVESLLMEGARRADELSALSATIESRKAVPRLSEKAGSDGSVLDLAPEEWEVVGRIDGVSDVKKIAWTLGRSEFEVSKVVSKLTEQGLLELGTQEEVARTKPPHEVSLDLAATLIERGELDDARAKVDSVLKRHPEEPRAHFLTARVLEREGDLKAAAQGYENTLSFDPLAEEARLRLGLVRLKLGDIDGAAREWTAYLRMVGDTWERRRAERALTALRELQTILGEFDGREHA